MHGDYGCNSVSTLVLASVFLSAIVGCRECMICVCISLVRIVYTCDLSLIVGSVLVWIGEASVCQKSGLETSCSGPEVTVSAKE